MSLNVHVKAHFSWSRIATSTISVESTVEGKTKLFLKRDINIHSHQLYMRDLIVRHPYQHLVGFFFKTQGVYVQVCYMNILCDAEI